MHFIKYTLIYLFCVVKKIIFKFYSSQEISFFIRILRIVNGIRRYNIIYIEQTDNLVNTNEVRYSLKSYTTSTYNITLKNINENLKQQYKVTYYNLNNFYRKQYCY